MSKPASSTRPATRLLSAEEAGEAYGFKPAYLREQARQGRLPSVKFDFFVRFDPADIEAWIDSRRRGGSYTAKG